MSLHDAITIHPDARTVARALAWLCEQRTPLINVSLVGPRNRVIEAIVAELVARGFIIVAAVGNDGPAAAPLYPAAYAGVVGVTGVDARGRALVEAGRGPQVDFAALGVVGGRGRAVLRGTSYAAPIVTGLWSLDSASGDLRLLNHAPSGDFTPILDSFGRVVFTQWDHLQRDQQADGDANAGTGQNCDGGTTYGTFNYADESANAAILDDRSELFPEPRACRAF